MEQEKNQISEERNNKEQFESFKKELDAALPKTSSEKLEFLKREEIKTMEKDVKRLREIEAEREKERIVELEKEKKAKKEQKAEPVIKKEEKKEDFIPKPPRKPWKLKKVLVRLAFVLIPVLVLGIFWWLFSNFTQMPEGIIPSEKTTPTETEKEETIFPDKPEIALPPSFISVEQVIEFEISDIQEITAIGKQLSEMQLPEHSFSRFVLKNEKDGKLYDLEDIAKGFYIEIFPGVIEKLNKEKFNTLIYPQEQGKRGVILAKIEKTEGLEESLKDWENKIIKEGLFVLNKQLQTKSSSFKNFTYNEKTFRYLTVLKEDLGVCYTVFGEYLVFSSSFESMQKTIDELRVGVDADLSKKIGQLFIVGFDGESVTPDLEEFFKKYKPGGILLLSKNVKNGEQLKNLVSNLQSLSQKETGLPLFIAVDQEGGQISRIDFLEEKTAQSEIKTQEEAYDIGLKRGQELKEIGVNLNLAPLLDYMNPEDFYFNRSFKKAPEISGELAKSIIAGQKEAGILTAIKHFPGYVNIPFNPESKLAFVPTPKIMQFKKAMESEPEMVMISNAIYQDIDKDLPSTFSEKNINYLKNNLGENIMIISDDLAQNSLFTEFSLKEIVTEPIKAGVDMIIFSGWRAPSNQAFDKFIEAVKNREVQPEKINEIFSKIVKLKEKI